MERKSFLKSKIFLTLLVLFIIVSCGLLIYFMEKPDQNLIPQPSTETGQALPEKEVLLFFDPNTLTASSGGRVNADIKIDAGDAEVSFVKLDISWDPEEFSNVTVTPFRDTSSALSSSFITTVEKDDPENGSVVITYTLINGAQQQKGQAILAKFSGVYTGVNPSSVHIFSDSTVATKSQEYSLKIGRVNLDITPR